MSDHQFTHRWDHDKCSVCGNDRSEHSTECAWFPDVADFGTWRTECGHVYQINEGTPEENKMAFCTYCGGSLRTRTKRP